MAHLIKLDDYVSRYQYDIYRYQSQYSRLKKDRWERLKSEWELSQFEEQTPLPFYKEQKSRFINTLSKLKIRNVDREDDDIGFSPPNYNFRFKEIDELRQFYYQELYHFQLKWASSTMLEKSTLNNNYISDPILRWLCGAFPDNYLVAYKPTVIYPKAPVQFDILLIGPSDVWCIVPLEGANNTIFQTHSERYWIETNGEQQKKIINPFLSLNRMCTILSLVMKDADQTMNLKKVVFTKEGYIDINNSQGQTQFLDKRSLNLWQEKMKNNRSPLKSNQLRFAHSLLQVCQTIAVKRREFIIEEKD